MLVPIYSKSRLRSILSNILPKVALREELTCLRPHIKQHDDERKICQRRALYINLWWLIPATIKVLCSAWWLIHFSRLLSFISVTFVLHLCPSLCMFVHIPWKAFHARAKHIGLSSSTPPPPPLWQTYQDFPQFRLHTWRAVRHVIKGADSVLIQWN